MKKYFVLFSVFIFCQSIAQDVNFSQHWNALTQFDVAKLASVDHLQAGITYRNQWPEEMNTYRTYAAHVSYPLLRQGLQDPQWGAVGVEFIGDASGLGGIYKKNQIKATANYKVALNQSHYLSFGISGSNLQTGLNTSGLTSGSQYQNGAYQAGSSLNETFQKTSSSMFFIDAGVRFSKKIRDRERWFLSTSVYNINKSNYGFEIKTPYPSRISVSGGMLLLETAYVKVVPSFLYQHQNTSALTVIGSNFYYKLNDFSRRKDGKSSLIGGGFYSRLQHDIIVSAEVKQEDFTFGMSYDFHTNKNSLRPTSSVELFLAYNIAVKSRGSKKKKRESMSLTNEATTHPIELKMRKIDPDSPSLSDTVNTTIVEIKLLDPTFDLNTLGAEVIFKNVDDSTKTVHDISYNKDSTSFITYLEKTTNYTVTIKKEGFYSKTLTFNTKQRDSLEIPNKLKLIVLGEVLILNKIHFKSGVDELDPSSETELTSLVQFLSEYPKIRAEISGHTDDLGSADLNLLLSQKRAEAIVTYLTYKDIERGRLEAKGFGESKPIVPNTSEENRAKNRRVELKIISK